MAVQTGSQTEAMRAKRDRYVARGVSIAPIFAVTRPRRPPHRRRRTRVHRLRRRHRRAQPRPHARGGRRRDQRAGRAAGARLLPRRRLRPVSRGVPDPVRARSRRLREEGAPDQLGRRGGRKRGQDRPLPHGPKRRDHLRPRLPRAHAPDDEPHLQARLQARHGAVCARDLPGDGAVPLPRHHVGRRARLARLDVQGDRRSGLGGLRDPRAGAGRGRVHRHAARVHPGTQGAVRDARHPLHRRRGAGRHGPHRHALGHRALRRRPRPDHRRQVARVGHAAGGRDRPLRGDGLGASGRPRLDLRRQPGGLRRRDREPARHLERRVPRAVGAAGRADLGPACAISPRGTT